LISKNVTDSKNTLTFSISIDSKGQFTLPKESEPALLTPDKPGFWMIASGDQAYLMSHQHDRHVSQKVENADAAQERLQALKRSGFWIKPEANGEYLLPASLWDTFAGQEFTATSGNSEFGVFNLKKS
jgi:hypothetical protein